MASLFGKTFQILLGGEDITHHVVKADLNTHYEYGIGVKLELQGVPSGPAKKGPSPQYVIKDEVADMDPQLQMALYGEAFITNPKQYGKSQFFTNAAAKKPVIQYADPTPVVNESHILDKKPVIQYADPTPVVNESHILDKIAQEMVDKKKGTPHE